jgi:taurine dehydrogenase small subunit
VTEEMLEAFIAAWRRADLDSLADFLTEDCVYVTTTGPAPGTEHRGKAAVLAAFAAALPEPDTTTVFGPAFVAGNRGVVEWRLPADDAALDPPVRGVDLFWFEGDHIIRKDAYRKVSRSW